MSQNRRPIIIRRKKVIHRHHGGSWKIALADFMTALMALFLVMWILSQASQTQREAVGEYFRTPLLTAITGGSGQAQSSNIIPGGGPDATHSDGERARIDLRQQTRPSDVQRRAFRDLQQRIETAINADPDLRKLRHQLRFEMTPEGLRIQLLDTEQRPMFELGSNQVAPYMRDLLRTMAPLLNELDNDLSISGHTDGLSYLDGYRGYSNWELSTDRANASRRELTAGGLAPNKLLRVSGFADRVPIADTEAIDPINRRIELLVLFDEVAERIRRPGTLNGAGEPSPLSQRTRQVDTAPAIQFIESLQGALGAD
ncbi:MULTISPECIES: flagellar motor protein MotB [unclassified Halomonas]|uniref:flagellar motor protein MotB n=1 Tax=unclassified Halomonas TaxID=2609666 RepID=UPI0028847FDB|nr:MULTISPECIES: flagellar motor protein MotB [unclassified Halomonas]MDT0500534.1 flagellar motor protein MotB [Halomonas sp. PAR7]MDT0511570.1 flagellar motor protein MotB [Halomonas sp. LES1]MDT0590142.1 flagellar motor protein MotB [Halomonas sp. PAR8]